MKMHYEHLVERITVEITADGKRLFEMTLPISGNLLGRDRVASWRALREYLKARFDVEADAVTVTPHETHARATVNDTVYIAKPVRR